LNPVCVSIQGQDMIGMPCCFWWNYSCGWHLSWGRMWQCCSGTRMASHQHSEG